MGGFREPALLDETRSGERPGSLRRLIAVAQQLELNYDLYGMNPGEILSLLPDEFDGWAAS